MVRHFASACSEAGARPLATIKPLQLSDMSRQLPPRLRPASGRGAGGGNASDDCIATAGPASTCGGCHCAGMARGETGSGRGYGGGGG